MRVDAVRSPRNTPPSPLPRSYFQGSSSTQSSPGMQRAQAVHNTSPLWPSWLKTNNRPAPYASSSSLSPSPIRLPWWREDSPSPSPRPVVQMQNTQQRRFISNPPDNPFFTQDPTGTTAFVDRLLSASAHARVEVWRNGVVSDSICMAANPPWSNASSPRQPAPARLAFGKPEFKRTRNPKPAFKVFTDNPFLDADSPHHRPLASAKRLPPMDPDDSQAPVGYALLDRVSGRLDLPKTTNRKSTDKGLDVETSCSQQTFQHAGERRTGDSTPKCNTSLMESVSPQSSGECSPKRSINLRTSSASVEVATWVLDSQLPRDGSSTGTSPRSPTTARLKATGTRPRISVDSAACCAQLPTIMEESDDCQED